MNSSLYKYIHLNKVFKLEKIFQFSLCIDQKKKKSNFNKWFFKYNLQIKKSKKANSKFNFLFLSQLFFSHNELN